MDIPLRRIQGTPYRVSCIRRMDPKEISDTFLKNGRDDTKVVQMAVDIDDGERLKKRARRYPG